MLLITTYATIKIAKMAYIASVKTMPLVKVVIMKCRNRPIDNLFIYSCRLDID